MSFQAIQRFVGIGFFEAIRMTPTPIQQYMISAYRDCPFVLGLPGRRVGTTTGLAMIALREALIGKKVGLLYPYLDLAARCVMVVQELMYGMMPICRQAAISPWLKSQRLGLEFANGGSIRAFTQDTSRGRSFDIVLMDNAGSISEDSVLSLMHHRTKRMVMAGYALTGCVPMLMANPSVHMIPHEIAAARSA